MPDPNKYSLFRLFVPTQEKLMFIGKKLMDEYLYLSDEYRNHESIYRILFYYVNAQNRNVIYEIGDFDGFLGFIDITPGWRANMTFKLWNPKRWGADFVRQAKGFIEEIMDELHLTRLETSSPDPRVVKMALMVGFKAEGTKRFGFLWNEKFYDDTILAMVKEDNNVLSR